MVPLVMERVKNENLSSFWIISDPIGIFNRPPANDAKSELVIVADNEKIAEATVAHMADVGQRLNRKMTPLMLVGDLGDHNSIERKNG
jgi:hypothetical protein